MATRKNDDERLDDASMERAIKCLEEKGTKKSACQILNISYNTTRLDKLINAYIEKKEQDAKRRAEKRGTLATKAEIDFVITEYLSGATIESINKALFRGNTFIKSILEEYAVPERKTAKDDSKCNLIPDEAARDRFTEGETVYSAKYDSLASIEKEMFQNDLWVYRIWVKGEQFYAYQPAYELASLQKLRDAGITI